MLDGRPETRERTRVKSSRRSRLQRTHPNAARQAIAPRGIHPILRLTEESREAALRQVVTPGLKDRVVKNAGI